MDRLINKITQSVIIIIILLFDVVVIILFDQGNYFFK